MKNINTQLASIVQEIDLGDINEAKKLSLLDEIGLVLTHRIILQLLEKTPEEKKETFVEKIKENKNDPDKILLFIDHFVEDADKIIDDEIIKCKVDLLSIVRNTD